MNLPSVKTLKAITSYPRELRALLEITTAEGLCRLLCVDQPFGAWSEFKRFKTHHGYQFVSGARFFDLKMAMADELCETCGTEYQGAGHNSKSPSFTYLNAGDGYTATLIYVRKRYRVGCWADIVERGHYD